ELTRNAPEGNVFPTKADLHTPEITSGHVKELARYLGADLVGIARLSSDDDEGYPFAVICAVQADYDPRQAAGIGGQVPVQNGLFITVVLSALIRELGFRTAASSPPNPEALAAAAGLAAPNANGKLLPPRYGPGPH